MQSDAPKTKTLSEAEIAERRAAFKRGAHNCAMEGLPLDTTCADLDEALIIGKLTREQYLLEVRKRIESQEPRDL